MEQHALHVTDYYCAMSLAQLRAMGACGRKAERKLSDDQFDDNVFSIENGGGEVY